MNEKTFNELYPEVELSVCPHEIQNFRNSIADISIPGQFCTYLEFRGEKYLNTFIVTNANDCPNLLSYDATFRMGVLFPNYPEENIDSRLSSFVIISSSYFITHYSSKLCIHQINFSKFCFLWFVVCGHILVQIRNVSCSMTYKPLLTLHTARHTLTELAQFTVCTT